ncbi:hypothetical protein BJ166DRAFT_590091 [Pestalotiopsis sp. NC0098]|nr:hypothetical protein BJ166DRAFT_590091 [Pestalotiopsis sp. NC0098]
MRLYQGISRLISGSKASAASPRQPLVKSFEKVFGGKIWQCEQITGHRVKSRLLFAEALNAIPDRIETTVRLDNRRVVVVPANIRLAVYGDAIIQAHLVKLWLSTGPASTRKQWTGVCQELLSNDNLATVYHEHEFQLCTLTHSEQVEMFFSKAKVKGKATLIEAVLGAIHLEGGDAALGSAMKRLGLTSHPDLPDDNHVATFRDQSTHILHHIGDEVKSVPFSSHSPHHQGDLSSKATSAQ